MKIVPANKTKIYDANDLPDMSEGIQMFFQNLVLDVLHKQNNNGFLKEFPNPIRTQGVRITQTARQLAMKPEGERNWAWSTLYMLPEPRLPDDSRVRIQGITYRVMSTRQNKEYNCCEYELLEDYDEE